MQKSNGNWEEQERKASSGDLCGYPEPRCLTFVFQQQHAHLNHNQPKFINKTTKRPWGPCWWYLLLQPAIGIIGASSATRCALACGNNYHYVVLFACWRDHIDTASDDNHTIILALCVGLLLSRVCILYSASIFLFALTAATKSIHPTHVPFHQSTAAKHNLFFYPHTLLLFIIFPRSMHSLLHSSYFQLFVFLAICTTQSSQRPPFPQQYKRSHWCDHMCAIFINRSSILRMLAYDAKQKAAHSLYPTSFCDMRVAAVVVAIVFWWCCKVKGVTHWIKTSILLHTSCMRSSRVIGFVGGLSFGCMWWCFIDIVICTGCSTKRTFRFYNWNGSYGYTTKSRYQCRRQEIGLSNKGGLVDNELKTITFCHRRRMMIRTMTPWLV